MIFANEFYISVSSNEYIRVIDVDIENDTLYFVICFECYVLPKPCRLSVFIDEVENKLYLKITDIFSKVIKDSDLSLKEIERRDNLWEIINKYWIENKDDLLCESKREKLFKLIATENDISKSSIKRAYSKFFERGMNRNSLLTDYPKCGGKGKDKKLSIAKIGRPVYYGDENNGVNVTNDIKIIFQNYLDRYYYKGKLSLTDVYVKIEGDIFSHKYFENGEMKSKTFDLGTYPTYHQFYYFYRKYDAKIKDKKKSIIEKQGINAFNLKRRELLSNSTIKTIGPGTKFQVDATVADIYLVSEFDRDRIIGRPVIYDIADVFSRMIVGIYIGLEGPSWIGAMMALDNMVADKVEFCTEYGININEKQWPSHHLPKTILADRGEFEGYLPENLINNLGINIENTPPYRGDLKGIVERDFRTINDKIKRKAPGAIMKEYRQRGDIDYRLKATLTLREFTKWIINTVLEHNNTAVKKYPLETDMILDEIAAVPTQLWQWGIANKRGSLSVIDRDILRLNVLPKAKASISRQGLRFKGLYYSSQKAIDEHWFITKKEEIYILYDPRNTNYIYIPDSDGKSFEKFVLLDKSKQYKDSFIEEIIFLDELKKEISKINEHNDQQVKIDTDRANDNIVKQSVAEKKNNIPFEQQTKTSQLKGISKNKQFEKDMNRENQKFELGEKTIKEVIDINVDTEDEPILTDEGKSIYNKIRKARNGK